MSKKSRETKNLEDPMGPVDLYLLPAEIDYRRGLAPSGPRYRRPRKKLLTRRAAQPSSRRLA